MLQKAIDMTMTRRICLEHPESIREGGIKWQVVSPLQLRRIPAGRFFVVQFRHPLRNDPSNRPGKKISKGLGTAERDEADRLVGQLNAIFRDESLHSVGARAEAVRRGFDPRVLEIFYAELETSSRNAKTLREKEVPLQEHNHQGRSACAASRRAGRRRKPHSTVNLWDRTPSIEAFPPTSVNRTGPAFPRRNHLSPR